MRTGKNGRVCFETKRNRARPKRFRAEVSAVFWTRVTKTWPKIRNKTTACSTALQRHGDRGINMYIWKYMNSTRKARRIRRETMAAGRPMFPDRKYEIEDRRIINTIK